jgi:hypothetical protein
MERDLLQKAVAERGGWGVTGPAPVPAPFQGPAGGGGMDVDAGITYDRIVTGIMPHGLSVIEHNRGIVSKSPLRICASIVGILTG